MKHRQWFLFRQPWRTRLRKSSQGPSQRRVCPYATFDYGGTSKQLSPFPWTGQGAHLLHHTSYYASSHRETDLINGLWLRQCGGVRRPATPLLPSTSSHSPCLLSATSHIFFHTQPPEGSCLISRVSCDQASNYFPAPVCQSQRTLIHSLGIVIY